MTQTNTDGFLSFFVFLYFFLGGGGGGGGGCQMLHNSERVLPAIMVR